MPTSAGIVVHCLAAAATRHDQAADLRERAAERGCPCQGRALRQRSSRSLLREHLAAVEAAQRGQSGT